MSRRILIATEAWHPQVNGVVRTLETTARTLSRLGHIVEVLEPTRFFGLPVPFYPEIRVTFPKSSRVDRLLRDFRPDHVHISTEGTLGNLVRRYCRMRDWRFSTSYHTRFPEYLRELAFVPERWSYAFLKRFHNRSSSLMVATPSLEEELKLRGFTAPMRRWSRGVDLQQFRPRPAIESPFPRPVLLYVGRVSAEKGLEDFLKLKTAGTKVIVGDGPMRAEWERRYSEARFLGYKRGEELGQCYAMADVFVFPSRTDTFGLVTIEALASGVPVAAYPVTGPKDVIVDPRFGSLDEDLARAVDQALNQGNRDACIVEGQRYTWENCTGQFLENLVPVRG